MGLVWWVKCRQALHDMVVAQSHKGLQCDASRLGRCKVKFANGTLGSRKEGGQIEQIYLTKQ